MRRNYIALALAACLGAVSVAGCTTNPATGLPTIDPTQLAAIESQVQQEAAAICGFVPTIESVAGVVASFVPVPGVGTAIAVINQAATAICNAVLPAKAAAMRSASGVIGKRTAGAAIPTVNGVPITGYFIK